MKKIRTTLRLDQLQLNEGQLDWMGRNPRIGTQEDIDKCVKSLLEDPDWLEDKPLSVTPAREKDEYVVFIGNLRTVSAPIAGLTEVPCIIYIPEKTPDPDNDGKLSYEVDRATIIRRALKDNGTFGHWDFDELPNWGIPAEQLASWGVPTWDNKDNPSPEDFGDQFSLPSGEGPASNQITFYFAAEQKSFIEETLKTVQEVADTFGNENANGNKLYTIVSQWAERRK